MCVYKIPRLAQSVLTERFHLRFRMTHVSVDAMLRAATADSAETALWGRKVDRSVHQPLMFFFLLLSRQIIHLFFRGYFLRIDRFS